MTNPVVVHSDDPPIPDKAKVFEYQLTMTVYYKKERLDLDVLFDMKLGV